MIAHSLGKGKEPLRNHREAQEFLLNVIEKNYTIEEATEKVRNLVKDLKDHGINIDTDEMNFEKSYQIIIKIYKENN